jgi:hypothetical protein
MASRLTLSFLLAFAHAAFAQTIVLSPAVVQLAGQAGQSVTQTLTLRNESDLPLEFVLDARDVIVRDGKRVFVDPAALPDSIASSAIFSPRTVRVAPHASGNATVMFTLPHAMRHRAVVATFRGRTLVKSGNREARLSLGTLFTFTVSDRISVAGASLETTPPSATAGAQLRSRLVNDGAEPLVATGMAVILDERGQLLGKVPFAAKRLLPGEAGMLSADYAGDLPAGSYRAVATIDIAGRPLTLQSALTVR